MSKAYSLAGIRLGWITGPDQFAHDVTIHRDYNTISVGMVDDHLACIALENAEAVLRRNRELVRKNNATLNEWIGHQDALSWVRPKGGTIALLEYSLPTPSRDLCVDLMATPGVLLTPGSALDAEGTLRIGYANNPTVLEAGLDRLADYLANRLAATGTAPA